MKKRNELPQDHLRVYDAIANAEGSITADKLLLQIGQEEKI